MKVHLPLLLLFGILGAFALTNKHEEESMESLDETVKLLRRSEKNCGLRPRLGSRIVDGEEAGMNDYPWMGSIRLKVIHHHCGGSLISLMHMLTASHCFWVLGPRNTPRFQRLLPLVSVVLGDHYLNTTDSGEQRFGVADILALQSDFNRSGVPLVNDVAVVRLNGTAIPSPYVSPICLPNSRIHLSPGDELTIAGWGIAKFPHYDPQVGVKQPPMSNFLRVTRTKVIEHENCINLYDIINGKTNDDIDLARQAGEDVICTLEDYGQGPTEPGDSGGPVMHYDPATKTWMVVGIVSYRTGRSGEKGIANVSYFLQEINAMITDLEKDITRKLLVGPQD